MTNVPAHCVLVCRGGPAGDVSVVLRGPPGYPLLKWLDVTFLTAAVYDTGYVKRLLWDGHIVGSCPGIASS